MTLKEEYDFLCERIEDLKNDIKNAKEIDVSPMTIQLKYMKSYQSILKYRIEKQIDLDESQTKARRKKRCNHDSTMGVQYRMGKPLQKLYT